MTKFNWLRKPHRNLSEKDRNRAANYLAKGWTPTKVAKKTGLTIAQISGLRGAMIQNKML